MQLLEDMRTALDQLVRRESLPARVLVREERGGGDLILEHSCVPGFGLALGVAPDFCELYWVDFGTLERSDAFDLARKSDRSIRVWSGPSDDWLDDAMAAATDAVDDRLTVQVGHFRRTRIYAVTPKGSVRVWSRRRPRKQGAPRVGDSTFRLLCDSFQ